MPDGRFVALTSQADNLVTGDSNGISDVFVHDRQTAKTTQITRNSDNFESDSPSISGDGRFVAYRHNPSDSRIHVYDRQVQDTFLLGGASYGVQPSVSSDGRFVAFDYGDGTGALDRRRPANRHIRLSD